MHACADALEGVQWRRRTSVEYFHIQHPLKFTWQCSEKKCNVQYKVLTNKFCIHVYTHVYVCLWVVHERETGEIYALRNQVEAHATKFSSQIDDNDGAEALLLNRCQI